MLLLLISDIFNYCLYFRWTNYTWYYRNKIVTYNIYKPSIYKTWKSPKCGKICIEKYCRCIYLNSLDHDNDTNIIYYINNNILFGSISNIFCIYHACIFQQKLIVDTEYIKVLKSFPSYCLFLYILKMSKVKKIQRISLQRENVYRYTRTWICVYEYIYKGLPETCRYIRIQHALVAKE